MQRPKFGQAIPHTIRAFREDRPSGNLCPRCLGAQWKLNRLAAPGSKELARVDQCAMKLGRAKALPVILPKLAQFIGVGCLSLLDYVNLADVKPYAHLRSLVKEALGGQGRCP